MKRKAISFILSLSLMLCLVISASAKDIGASVCEADGKYYENLQTAIDISKGTTEKNAEEIELTANVTLGKSGLIIPSGYVVKLDLEGYILSGAEGCTYSVITVEKGATLIMDGDDGVITGGNAKEDTRKPGESGGNGGHGGGICCAGNLFIKDTVIDGNYAVYEGGGIYLLGGGNTFVIDDCVIKNNSCDNMGAGFYQYSGNLTLTDTTVTGNHAGKLYGGGFYNGSKAVKSTMTMGGKTVIMDNTAGKEKINSNLYLYESFILAEGDNYGMDVSVFTDNKYVCSNCTASDVKHVSSDDEAYVAVFAKGDPDAELAEYNEDCIVLTKAVAQIGKTKYPSLSDAVANAKNGDKIVLLEGSSETVTVKRAVSFELEGADFVGTIEAGKGYELISEGRSYKIVMKNLFDFSFLARIIELIKVFFGGLFI